MPAGRCWSWRSLIMLLLWLYYSSQILFSERELAHVYATRFGSHVAPANSVVRLLCRGMHRHETMWAVTLCEEERK